MCRDSRGAGSLLGAFESFADTDCANFRDLRALHRNFWKRSASPQVSLSYPQLAGTLNFPFRGLWIEKFGSRSCSNFRVRTSELELRETFERNYCKVNKYRHTGNKEGKTFLLKLSAQTFWLKQLELEEYNKKSSEKSLLNLLEKTPSCRLQTADSKLQTRQTQQLAAPNAANRTHRRLVYSLRLCQMNAPMINVPNRRIKWNYFYETSMKFLHTLLRIASFLKRLGHIHLLAAVFAVLAILAVCAVFAP